jgi:hypothetical protein
VIFTLHEMKRPGRGAAELLAIAEELRRHDIELELLSGPLQGIYNPSGHGAELFAFFAGMAKSEREYIREKSLEGQASAPRTQPARRPFQGVRRRHDRLCPVAARPGRGGARYRPQACHLHGQEQGPAALGGQRPPGLGRRRRGTAAT